MKRKSLGEKLRFEVFKRDSFKCQYCGASAPDVILNCDHVIPVKEGGTNSIANLVTSCKSCNSGKGARQLSDSSAVKLQKDQLDAIQERKSQIEMMAKWQKSLISESNHTVDALADIWKDVTCGNSSINTAGRRKLVKLLKEFSFQEISEAMRVGAESYDMTSYDGAALCFSKLGGIARVKKLESENPAIGKSYYIRGILRRRFGDTNGLFSVISDVNISVANGWRTIGDLITFAKTCRSPWEFSEFANSSNVEAAG